MESKISHSHKETQSQKNHSTKGDNTIHKEITHNTDVYSQNKNTKVDYANIECWFKDRCWKGEICKYKHTNKGISKTDTNRDTFIDEKQRRYNSQECRFQENCTWGAKCKYWHRNKENLTRKQDKRGSRQETRTRENEESIKYEKHGYKTHENGNKYRYVKDKRSNDRAGKPIVQKEILRKNEIAETETTETEKQEVMQLPEDQMQKLHFLGDRVAQVVKTIEEIQTYLKQLTPK